MASVTDLTYDGSSDENTAPSPPSKHRVIKSPNTRQPLNPVQNNVRLPPIASIVSNIDLRPALTQALCKSSDKRVRELLMRVCREQPAAKALVEREFLVPAGEVVPYHADTESEDEGLDSEDGNEEESDHAAGTTNQQTPGNMAPVLPTLKRKIDDSIADELVPRFAKCENCKEEFDVTINERGDCVWHPGKSSQQPHMSVH
jgi:hypothetical protein